MLHLFRPSITHGRKPIYQTQMYRPRIVATNIFVGSVCSDLARGIATQFFWWATAVNRPGLINFCNYVIVTRGRVSAFSVAGAIYDLSRVDILVIQNHYLVPVGEIQCDT